MEPKSEEIEKEREVKQHYLQKMILEQNYDTEEFLSFLKEIKQSEDATNIDSWSLEDLTAVVLKFIDKVGKSGTETANDTSADMISPNSNLSKRKSSSSENSVPPTEVRKCVDYQKTLTCFKLESNPLPEAKKLQIKVSDPEKHSGGFFSSAYTTYLVSTDPVGYKVKRRYSEFEWLRNLLFLHFPGVAIPPLPKKQYSDRFMESFVYKRMRFLEKFMESLSSIPEVLHSKILYNFLLIDNEKEFEKLKNQYNKEKPPVTLSDIKTIDGQLVCRITEQDERNADIIRNYLFLNDELIKKTSNAFKLLNSEVNTVANRVREISEYFNQLFYVSEKFGEKLNMKDSYSYMSKICSQWSETLKLQSTLFDQDIREHFSYMRKEFVSFKETMMKLETKKYTYSKAESKLYYKKEDLFKTSNVPKWELSKEDEEIKSTLIQDKTLAFSKMLPKESKIVENLKNEYGYYLDSANSEFSRIIKGMGNKSVKHLVSFTAKHSNLLTELSSVWSEHLQQLIITRSV